MKKFILLLLILSFAFTLSSCSENMANLLSYQKSEMAASVKICDGEREYLADIFQNGEEKRIVFRSPKEYENVEIIFCDGLKIIKYDTMEIKRSGFDAETDKIYSYVNIFSLCASGKWEISNGKINGAPVKACDNGKIVAYISKNPLLPCRFDINGAQIEIISLQ